MASPYNVSVPIPVLETLLRDALLLDTDPAHLLLAVTQAAAIMTHIYGEAGSAQRQEIHDAYRVFHETFAEVIPEGEDEGSP